MSRSTIDDTLTYREVCNLIYAGKVRWNEVQPYLMPGGETWYVIIKD